MIAGTLVFDHGTSGAIDTSATPQRVPSRPRGDAWLVDTRRRSWTLHGWAPMPNGRMLLWSSIDG